VQQVHILQDQLVLVVVVHHQMELVDQAQVMAVEAVVELDLDQVDLVELEVVEMQQLEHQQQEQQQVHKMM
jgi:hypothetical protein